MIDPSSFAGRVELPSKQARSTREPGRLAKLVAGLYSLSAKSRWESPWVCG